MSAAGLPAVATGKVVMVAMPCVKPAVVDGPDHMYAAMTQIVKQYSVVQEIAVYIVDMHNVRPYLLNPLNELLCGPCRGESVPVEQPGLDTVPGHAEAVSYRNRNGGGMQQSVTASAVGNITFPAILHSQFTDFFHYPPRGGVRPQHRINLQECFTHFSLSPA